MFTKKRSPVGCLKALDTHEKILSAVFLNTENSRTTASDLIFLDGRWNNNHDGWFIISPLTLIEWKDK